MRANPFVGEPAGEPVYLDDLDRFVETGQAVRDTESEAVRHEGVNVRNAWGLVKGYWGAREGRMLVAAPGQNAPTLSFDPGVRGRYAICVCTFGKRAFGWPNWPDGSFGVHVRLSTDRDFTPLFNERNEPSFEEMYFKTVCLDGETRIEIGHFNLKTFFICIKLVPVRESSLSEPTKTTIGILDFADDAPLSHPRDLAAASSVRRHAEMGYDMIMWKAGNAMICEYRTKVGKMRDDDTVISHLLTEYDVMRQAVDEAKRIGIPIYGWSRLLRDAGEKGDTPPTPFHAAHPDQVQTSKRGVQSWKLSFAFPEARRHMTDMLCEMAGYGMDGIFIDVLRHPSAVMYDLPLVEEFLRKTGEDPRKMDGDGTEEWLRFRADAFTQFLRETRLALDKQAEGARYPLIVRTVDQPWRNLYIGCDIERWMDEEILDGIIFAPHCPFGANYPERQDLTHYLQAAQGRVKVYGQVWRESSGIQAELLAGELYAQGVDGVALYESNLTVSWPSMRERLWRFSRPQSLARLS